MAPESSRHIELKRTVAQMGEYGLYMLQNADMVTIAIVDAAILVHAVQITGTLSKRIGSICSFHY